jgi:hypothetical protein
VLVPWKKIARTPVRSSSEEKPADGPEIPHESEADEAAAADENRNNAINEDNIAQPAQQNVPKPAVIPVLLRAPEPARVASATPTTSEDDLMHAYHAHIQTSDSDSCNNPNRTFFTRKRLRLRGTSPLNRRLQALELGAIANVSRPRSSSQSSSDLSSPSETCYGFVRRALQVDILLINLILSIILYPNYNIL